MATRGDDDGSGGDDRGRPRRPAPRGLFAPKPGHRPPVAATETEPEATDEPWHRTIEVEPLRPPEVADPDSFFSPDHTMDLGGVGRKARRDRNRPDPDRVSFEVDHRRERPAREPARREPRDASGDTTILFDLRRPRRGADEVEDGGTTVLGRPEDLRGPDDPDATVVIGRASRREPEGAPGDATVILGAPRRERD
ncbi:MAG: hypothetical protein KC635_22285 [Myxococcales bacterium]|nr:hypothetical protein [Myxococcales bacterium]